MGSGRKPRRPVFSQRGSYTAKVVIHLDYSVMDFKTLGLILVSNSVIRVLNLTTISFTCMIGTTSCENMLFAYSKAKA